MSKRANFREIAVDSDGQLLVSVDGKLSGSSELIVKAKRNSVLREQTKLVEPHGEYFEANLDDGNPFGELAALMSVNPGRSIILKAPEEVTDYLEGKRDYAGDSAFSSGE